MPPTRRPSGLLRLVLIAAGASTLVSALVNLMAAIRLLEPSDEQVIGLSRGYLLIAYSLQLVLGGLLIFLGCRKRR